MARCGGVIKRLLGACRAIGAAGAPGALAQPTRAAPQPAAATCAPCDTSGLLRGLPGDTEAVVMIANAARQRTSPAGQALQALLRDAGTLPETGAAWSRLAAALDWSADQAFDELLGRRVTLVMRGLNRSGEPDWAILSDVTAATERRLRERLQASPRGTSSGLPVLGVEDGAFELTIARSPDLKADGPGLATIVLSPGPRAAVPSTLVQELALSEYVRSQRLLPGSPQARPCEIVLMLRSSPASGEASRTLALTALSQDDGWQAHLVCSPGLVWNVPAGGELKEWSAAPFEATAADCLLAVMGVAGAAPSDGVATSIHGLENLLPAVSGLVKPAEARRGALLLRRLTLDGAGRSIGPAEPDPGSIMVSGRVPAGAGARAALSLTVAFESADRQAMVVDGDRAVAGALCVLQNGPQYGQAASASVCMEVGVPDGSPRRIRLDDEVSIAEPYRPTLDRLFGPGAELVWGACPPARGEPRCAWWSATLAPAGAPLPAPLALAGPRSADARRRLSVGLVRPADLVRTLRTLGAPGALLEPLSPVRRVDALRWDAWVRDDGMVEANVSLRMAR
jgi:hypothetical protein